MIDIVFLRGLPGSGKSTYAKKWVCSTGGLVYHFEGDQYFTNPDGSYHFHAPLLPAAHASCFHRFQEAVWKARHTIDTTIIVANCFHKAKFLQPYLDFCADRNLSYRIYHLIGNFSSVHDVPPATIAKMKQEWEYIPEEIVVNPLPGKKYFTPVGR